MDILSRLLAMQDLSFQKFNAKLIPNLSGGRVIGIKTPQLKQLAKELEQSGEGEAFLRQLPHTYFEENQLHAFMISRIRDYDRAVRELERFLPFVDNWATCDQLIPVVVAREPERLLPKVMQWLQSGHTYTVRYGIGVLMRYFLDERFQPCYLERVAQIRSEEYYVNMVIAWYFATALAKQYGAALPYIQAHRLSKWVHNKTIQKACESRRVQQDHKQYLRIHKYERIRGR